MASQGKSTVVITGGDKGIGASISKLFYQNGYYVFIASRHNTGLANKFKERGMFHKLDVRSPVEIKNMIQAVLDWRGSFDVFINNAGYSAWKSVSDVDEEFWCKMIDTNLKGTFFGSQAASATLKPGGCIVNVSSLASKRGSANNSVYCASKFGVNGITQALAKELGPKGIRVNAVCPVYVQTPGLLESLKKPDSPTKGKETAKFLEQFAKANASLQRLPQASEVADLCLYLASPAASAVTGQCINVDCGVLPQ